ncbi:MAG TPA: single-stranded-DNA-specific exonuclease RecJ [Candidatus Angelobacter sp.]|nr:single-stranded-DNA-specific exonuclease RecJ [Candidatus Angelobacter sp.]
MHGAERAFLGVERSFGGRAWRQRRADDRQGLAIAQRFGVPELVGRLLAARDVTIDSAAAFLNPTLRELLPDPSRFRDMDRAVERLLQAVTRQEKIAVFGDYDVDGATSAALLHRFFAAIGVAVRLYIPDRLTEGYGPNAPALLRLREEGIAVAITVDCGITAFAALAAAADVGLAVIVLDHHVAEPQLPAAAAVVNPNRLDETAGHGQLAAVGVTFLLVVALNRALRTTGWYGDGRAEPDLKQWLDLVALGTVCDVVPLTALNRALVGQGLKVMARRGNVGLAALADVAGLKETPGTYHAGFLLGPRINAGGRVGAADLGVRLLTTTDAAEATDLARQLDGLNAERRALEQVALEAAIAQVEGQHTPERALVFASSAGWHPGVIGIVAGRLKERYGRPACVVATADGIGKGSGRSINGLDLGSAVIAARQAGLLINGGGHAMAAGFTVAAERVADLAEFLNERLASAAGGPIVPLLEIDGAVAGAAATPELAQMVGRLAPFGSGNPEPRFAVTDLRVVRSEVVGEGHVRLLLAGNGGTRLKAIAFRSADGPLGQALLRGGGAPLHLAGNLRLDNWQDREGVQLIVDDGAPAQAAGA